MRFVVDASVAVKLLVDEPESDAARELAASGRELHAPRLMAFRGCQCAVAQGAAGSDRARRRRRRTGLDDRYAAALERR